MIERENLILPNGKGWITLASLIAEKKYSKLFILVDENTEILCLPIFYIKMEEMNEWKILKIRDGEKNKNIETCIELWQELLLEGADRHSLVINLGGGMISDLGGFIASTFKRGIDFVNIPTTLLGMVDASIGGKNGIDFKNAKNQVGTVNQPKLVVIEHSFLKTLPKEQLISGMAEMMKHSLISSKDSWNRFVTSDLNDKAIFENLIWESIEIKNKIVQRDPLEKGLRKTLNFGHTLGHAIESHCLDNPYREALLHGEAIAIGIILATFLSTELLGFPQNELLEVYNTIESYFPKQKFSKNEISNIIKLLSYDKKNIGGKVLFVLLEEIGKPKTDCFVSDSLIFNAFEFYEKS
ncbi:3-dehydroquinate synthase [Aequorivita sp. H23M31]|uniref:3-dehydroquinate synthase n=1 Tax=Aequorivita ciconiae TaxID=2494375 RepID=A0A410G0Y3_9FLAO|nr:3-dehydroquinate synthase [Aequorivita sp. H23M31]QAA80936.1 3-dehydroquinate synthase [Aequorivita sp. H23M31]